MQKFKERRRSFARRPGTILMARYRSTASGKFGVRLLLSIPDAPQRDAAPMPANLNRNSRPIKYRGIFVRFYAS